MKKLISIVTLLAMLLSAVSFAAPVADQAVEGIDEFATDAYLADTTLAAVDTSAYGELITPVFTFDTVNDFRPSISHTGASTGWTLTGYYNGGAAEKVHFQKHTQTKYQVTEFIEDTVSGSYALHYKVTDKSVISNWYGAGLYIGLFSEDVKSSDIKTTKKPLDLEGGKVTLVFDIRVVDAGGISVVLNNGCTGQKSIGGLFANCTKDAYETIAVTFDTDASTNVLFGIMGNGEYYIDNIQLYYKPLTVFTDDQVDINVDTSETNNKTGIRLRTTLANEFANAETTTQYGFIATLKTKLDDAGVAVDDFKLENANFPATTQTGGTNYIVGYAYDKALGTNIIYDVTDAGKVISGVFYGIPAGSYDTEIVLRPFVAQTVGDVTTYTYGNAVVDSAQNLASTLKNNASAFGALNVNQQAIVDALIANVAAQ